MSTKRKIIKQEANPRLTRISYFLQVMMYSMAAVVLYDSIFHATPLYYIGFYFAGLVIGRIYKFVMNVELSAEGDELVLKTSKWDLVLTAFLIVVRFAFGTTILESVHVVWASDAIYLFFIGVYRSKWKGLVRQIDEIVYQWIARTNKNSEL